MVSRVLSILFFGSLFTLFPTAAFLAGVMENYLKFYGIKEFFNPFFFSTVNGILFWAVSVMSGYLIIHFPWPNFFRVVYILVVLASLSAFAPSIGRGAGERLFMKAPAYVTLEDGKSYQVRELYRTRDTIYYLGLLDGRVHPLTRR